MESRARAPPGDFRRIRDGHVILDVGSGTGALTAAVAAVAPSSRIIGIDPAAQYVAFAERQHPGDRVRFEVGDAQQLRFLNGSFDRTLSLLVLNFVPDPAKALDEITRSRDPAAPSRQRCGTTDRTWRCCASSGTRRSRSILPRPRGMSDTCRSVVRENFASSGANTGCGMCRRRRSQFERDSARSMITGRRCSTAGSGGRIRCRTHGRRARAASTTVAWATPRRWSDRAIVLSARAWAVRGVVP